MQNSNDIDAAHHLVYSRNIRLPGERSALYAQIRSGSLVRVLRGCYIRLEVWDRLDLDERYRVRVHAAAGYFGRFTVFSHESAAAMWRLPWIGRWSDRAHAIGVRAGGGRSSTWLIRHIRDVAEPPAVIDGLRVTGLASTVVDLAATLEFGRGIVIADAALRRTAEVSRSDLQRLVSSVPSTQGAARARAVIAFADGAADRPGESLSRVAMHRARIPLPQLQAELQGASGTWWTVDFWWPQFNVIGEFDGKLKYTDPQFRNGRTADEVLYDEKMREDDLRAAGFGFTRWPWKVALSAPALKAHLARAGVH